MSATAGCTSERTKELLRRLPGRTASRAEVSSSCGARIPRKPPSVAHTYSHPMLRAIVGKGNSFRSWLATQSAATPAAAYMVSPYPHTIRRPKPSESGTAPGAVEPRVAAESTTQMRKAIQRSAERGART